VRNSRTRFLGSNSFDQVGNPSAGLPTCQATPRWAHHWATPSPVTDCLLTRLAGSKSFPSLRSATRDTQPRLPSGGSLGSHFPTFIGTTRRAIFLCSATTATCPSRSPSLVHRYLVCSFRSCPFFRLVDTQELLCQRPACLVSRYAFSGLSTRRQLALPSSQAIPLSACPALRPRW
jgi:hypothetical protein